MFYWWGPCSFLFSVLCFIGGVRVAHLFIGGVRVAHLFSFLCCVLLVGSV